jgi:hypothetical protein
MDGFTALDFTVDCPRNEPRRLPELFKTWWAGEDTCRSVVVINR